MEIVFLGTGGSFPSPQRGVSSVAIKTHGEVILFDCGEGTQRQLMRSSLSFMSITKIFITHFHGDHYLGLAGLLQTMALNGRTKDLEIFGPKGTEKLVTILERISYYSRTYDLVLHEMKEGQRERFDGFAVTAVRLDHSIPTLGYLLEEDDRPGKFDVNAARIIGIPPGPLYSKLQEGEEIVWDGKVIEPAMVMGPSRPGRKVAIAMDTKPILTLPDRIIEFDVLIHEATADRSLENKANKFGHSTAAQAATIAKEAKVKRLFLVHISPRYRDPKPLLDEARSIFEESYLPSDLEEYEVPLPESWEEDDALWVVEGREEGEEATPSEDELEAVSDDPGRGEAVVENILTSPEPGAAPIPTEVMGAEAASDMSRVVEGVEGSADGAGAIEPEAEVDEEPKPQPKEDIIKTGISLTAVEAAMEGKTSRPRPVPVPAKKPVKTLAADDEDEEFDLDRAMIEAGIDPDADDV